MKPFKNCTYCDHLWSSREDFLTDPDIDLVGYQVNFQELELGLFLFNHEVCKTTIALPAGIFKDLYNGPVFEERQTGTDQCLELCLHEQELSCCPSRCECAFVREILNIVKHWPKNDE
jgi:hypothetical protein